MFRGMWVAVAAAFMVMLFSVSAPAAESKGRPATKDEIKAVTAVINDMTKACKAKDKEKVKKFLTKASLEELKKDASMLDMFMEMCSDNSITKDTKYTVDGNKMTLVTVTKDKDGSMTMTQRMVKEDGQWKTGK